MAEPKVLDRDGREITVGSRVGSVRGEGTVARMAGKSPWGKWPFDRPFVSVHRSEAHPAYFTTQPASERDVYTCPDLQLLHHDNDKEAARDDG